MPVLESFSEKTAKIFNKNLNTGIRNVTLQITDDCCCACTYCYQKNKGKRYMTKEVAKACIDLLFKMNQEITDINAVIHNQTLGIILDFIGGEPLMNLPIIDYSCEYFMDKCLELEHPWINTWRASMISNGAKYFEADTQKFIDKFNGFVSFGITLDGPREIHNACRIYHNGTGNFDDAYAAFKDCQKRFNMSTTKVTISPENLQNINTIIDFFVEEGIVQINSNPIFEHNWTIQEAKIYYNELKIIADKILTKYKNISSSLFIESLGQPLSPNSQLTWCGGLGHMLAFDPDGNAFPCIRYMESSLGNDQLPIIIGNCFNGIYQTNKEKQIYKDMTSITRESQSTKECFNCPIASGCAYCAAWNYQVTGKFNSRVTYICNMHKARSLANVYYWNNYYANNNIPKVFNMNLPKEEALNYITKEEYNMLLDLVISQKEKVLKSL